MVALLLAVGGAMAAQPEGPRLTVVKVSAEWTRTELLTVGPDRRLPVRLAGGGEEDRPLPYPYLPPSWSPNGAQIAFTGISRRNGRGLERIGIFLVKAGGGGSRAIPKTGFGFGPLFSPDGRTIAFTRFIPDERTDPEAATIWTVDIVTGSHRRLTPQMNGLRYFATSFSPDGSTLLAMRQDDLRGGDDELVGVPLDGSDPVRLPIDGIFPVYSPDGSKIVLLRDVGDQEGHDLFVFDVTTGGLRRLTHTPQTAESSASWDPSGERIAYTRSPPANSKARAKGIGSAVMQINADGSCNMKLLSASRASFFVPVWQPGTEREAGRIEC